MTIGPLRRSRSLPLGIDVGTNQIRVALVERDAADIPRLIAVASRPAGDNLAAALRDAVDDLPTSERRCVLGMSARDGMLRTIHFPPMSRSERERAATFEAARFIDYPIEDAFVCIRGIADDPTAHVLGIARRSMLDMLTGAVKQAGLRCVAVDNGALAIARAMPDADAVLDIGATGSTFFLFGGALPRIQRFEMGGNDFTDAIAESLGIDIPSAERRKRTLGLSGAGLLAFETFIEAVASCIVRYRTSGAEVRRLTLIGNGARLINIVDALATATAIPTALAAFDPSICETLPPDVVRAASPDWCMAFGLTLWETAV
jgi:Tfp pilus assembly PilM family ATPase